MLVLNPGPDYLVALMACLCSGTAAVPLHPPRDPKSLAQLRRVFADSRSDVLISSLDIHGKSLSIGATLPEGPTMQWFLIDENTGPAEIGAPESAAVSPEALAVLQYTSGSTGHPKGVALTHRQLLAQSRIIRQQFDCTPASVGVIWLPPFHDMGLIGGLLQPLYAGFPVHLMSPASFLQRPWRWLELISRVRGTVSAAPNFAYELCAQSATPEQLARLDLSSWRVAANGAEPLRAETMERFAGVFSACGFNKRSFLPCYGLAEAALYVTGETVGRGASVLHVDRGRLQHDQLLASAPTNPHAVPMVSSGAPADGVAVRIADPHTAIPLPDGRVGEIWVRSPSVALGYWDRPADTERCFHARLAGSGDGQRWLRTGDLGALHGGQLYVTGRIKDLLIIHGKNHYPQDIEASVMATPAGEHFQQVIAFALPGAAGETLGLLVELTGRHRPASLAEWSRQVRHAVSSGHQLQVAALGFVPRHQLPRTTSGKPRRHAVREGWLQGSLPLWTEQESAALEPVSP